MDQQIRNFAIIAHVDHGKSTLADRFLELTGVVSAGKHAAQLLDANPISRERGITIKLAPVRMIYESGIRNLELGSIRNSNFKIRNSINNKYILNLIDTPGHVDFSYEVERTLACVEGVILLVDATAGIQAQTVAHTYKALEKNLTLIPAVNKIDAPHAQIEQTTQELADFLGIDEKKVFKISAKSGVGTADLLKAVVQLVPSPQTTSEVSGDLADQAKALIFDSHYDPYRGVIAFVRVVQGEFAAGHKSVLCAGSVDFVSDEVGYFTPSLEKTAKLSAGDIGYIVTKLKNIKDVRVGDTIINMKNKDKTPLPGYRKVKPMIYTSLFPTDTDDFVRLKESLEKLALNDAALEFVQIYSKSLGAGFRVGFLGLLHAEVTRERLEREYDLDLVLTPATVEFKIEERGGREIFYEPIANVVVVTPAKYLNAVLRVADGCRAILTHMDNQVHVQIHYQMPVVELVTHFFQELKSVSSGFATFDWDFEKYEQVVAGRLKIMINNDPVDEFSEYVVEERAYERARNLVDSLAGLIPRQQFEVRIQAVYRGKIIASSRLSALRKDVTQKLYGGDRTRKDKLLKKQKAGKKRMKMVGSIQIPKEAFIKLFRRG